MINFGNIHIIGYCSIPELKLDLNKPGITIIRGENGFGKSKIFSALIWALYGKNLNGISNVNTWKEKQPKNYRGTSVELYFTVDSDTYKIIRCQEYKEDVQGAPGSNRLILLKNGNEVNTKGKIQLQEEIIKSLGMTYELFVSSVVFGQNMVRLINEPNSNKREVFEQIFSMGFLEKAKDYTKDKYTKYHNLDQAYYTQLKSLFDKIKSEKETIKDQSKSKKAFEKIQVTRRKEILSRIEKLKSTIRDFEEKKNNIPKDTEGRSKTIKSECQVKEEKLRIIEKTLGNVTLTSFIDELWTLCKLGKFKKLTENLRVYKDLFKKQNELEQDISKLKDQLSKVNKDLFQLNSIEGCITSTREDLISTQNELYKLSKEKPPKVLKKKNHLKEYQEDFDKMKEQYNLNKVKLNEYNWLLQDPLGNSGIKAYLFQNALSLVNEYLEKYADILGFSINISVNMDSARKDFVTTIERDGVEMDYRELSGGQQQLVNLSMAFAMNGVLSSSKGINVILLDEIFESLSENNIDVVISLLKSQYKDKSIYMITHLNNLPISGNIIQVGYKNGLSNYTL